MPATSPPWRVPDARQASSLGGSDLANVEPEDGFGHPHDVRGAVPVGDFSQAGRARVGLDLDDRLRQRPYRAVTEDIGRGEGNVDRSGPDCGDLHLPRPVATASCGNPAASLTPAPSPPNRKRPLSTRASLHFAKTGSAMLRRQYRPKRPSRFITACRLFPNSNRYAANPAVRCRKAGPRESMKNGRRSPIFASISKIIPSEARDARPPRMHPTEAGGSERATQTDGPGSERDTRCRYMPRSRACGHA